MKYSLIRTFLAAVAVFFAVNAGAQDALQLDKDKNDPSVSSTFPKKQKVKDKEDYKVHVGAKAGLSNPEGSYNSAPEFGVDIGFQPYVPFGLGATFTTSRNVSKSGNTRDLERTSVLARGTYNFGGNTAIIKNSWVGVAAGPVFRRDGTDLGVAPTIGFDIPMREALVGSYLSLGVDTKYLALINSDESDALSINGVVKYWF